MKTDGLYFWSARNGTPKANKYVAIGFQIELVLQRRVPRRKLKNTVRGGLKSSTYETDVKRKASASSFSLD